MVAATLVAALGFGLWLASCSSGLSASESAACGVILKVTIPTYGVGEGGIGVLPKTTVESLIHSGNATLSRYGRSMTHPESSTGFASTVNGAQAECQKIGTG